MDRDTSTPRIVVIGAGMSGLCMAIRLKQSGFTNVRILESSQEVGGTWAKNTYPNCGCDVPSYLYSFSFAPNLNWTTKYARQPEIHEYFRSCVERFDLASQIQFGAQVDSANFGDQSGEWSVQLSGGEQVTADVVISAVGQLNRPSIPKLPGLETYGGDQWHSAAWRSDVPLEGKDVAIIGNGASAIQLLPEVVKVARRTTSFQRTPSYIHPLKNIRYSPAARWAFRNVPLWARLYRWWIFASHEARIAVFRDGTWLNREYGRWLRSRMRRIIPESDRDQLLPNYPPGCKRILLSNNYLQALAGENVGVITEPIERIDRSGVVAGGEHYIADAIIFATGFKANEFLQPMQVVGKDGRTLDEVWHGRPRSFYGMMMPGFPNFFMLYGPNTNLGHNSIIFMVECQVNYLLKCLREQSRRRAGRIEVKPEVMDQFDGDVQERLKSSVWAGDCTNWYKNSSGSIPNNWYGSATAYWRRLRRPRFDDFVFE